VKWMPDHWLHSWSRTCPRFTPPAVLFCPFYGVTPFPAKRGTQPILLEVLPPGGAPQSWRDREVLWNEVEARERRRDAGLAREVEFALPAELLPGQAAALACAYVLAAFVAEGMVADLSVHWALREDGQPKPYAQVLLTLRQAGPGGFGLKQRAWNDRANAGRAPALGEDGQRLPCHAWPCGAHRPPLPRRARPRAGAAEQGRSQRGAARPAWRAVRACG